ncbi:MAG: ACP S-malonyltransferase [Cyanobacteria bacterium P01_H01_bin.15]
MTKTVWLFPGQGSQSSEMAADLAETTIGKSKFVIAEEILGWSVPQRCAGPEEELNRTRYTQPCLFVVESILVDLLKEAGSCPDVVAGHSLGEYVALYAAGVFDFETGLKLVKTRAELMDRCEGGQMAAVMKFDREKLAAALSDREDVVLANDNSEQQVVISGTPDGVTAILETVKPRRSAVLKVSGAFHSPMMAEPAAQFQPLLEQAAFDDAKMPVLSNVAPEPTRAAAALKINLQAQLSGAVRWRETMAAFTALGVDSALEVGPGKVLGGLIKRACPDISVQPVNSAADVPQAVA